MEVTSRDGDPNGIIAGKESAVSAHQKALDRRYLGLEIAIIILDHLLIKNLMI